MKKSLFRGHSKSTFVEEGRRGWRGWSLKSEQKRTGGGGPSMCVRSLFLKKMLRFSKWSLIVILQFFLLIIMAVWNIKQVIHERLYLVLSMNGMRSLSPALFTFSFFFLHCPLFSLRIVSKNGYLFIGYRCVLRAQ